MGNDVPPADLVRVSERPAVEEQPRQLAIHRQRYTFYNVKYKPFDNKLVRQAINYAINRDKLVKLQSGAASVLQPDLSRTACRATSPTPNYYPYDPAKAKELLAQAGYPNGFKTTYWCLNTDPFAEARAVDHQRPAGRRHPRPNLKLMEESAYWTATAAPSKGISIGITDWYMDFPDPSDWIGPLFSKASTEPGGMDAGNWWDPQVEALSKQAEAMPPGHDRIALYTQMQQIIMEEAAVDPMFQLVGNPMFGPNVGGYYIHPVWINNYIDYWRK